MAQKMCFGMQVLNAVWQKKHKPEEIAVKLRQVEALLSQGRPFAEAIRTIRVTDFTYYRWRKEFGGLKSH